MTTKTIFQNLRQWHEALSRRKAVRLGILLAIVLSMISAGWKLWTSSQLSLEHLAWPLALAIVVATAHRFVNAFGWALVLRAMRFRVDGIAATRLWLTAESRRWLPGGVWGYASRATMAGRIGVDSVSATASMLLELMLVVFAAVVVSGAGLVAYGHHFEAGAMLLMRGKVVAATVGIVVGFMLLCWLVRHRLLAKLDKLRSRFRSLQHMRLSLPSLAVAALFFVAMNLLGGIITVVLTRAIPGAEAVPIGAVLAASSAAWCVGFFAFLAPGGLLVREAALAAMLAPWIPYTDALALAVLTRLAQLVAEGIAILWLAAARTDGAKMTGEVETPIPVAAGG